MGMFIERHAIPKRTEENEHRTNISAVALTGGALRRTLLKECN